MARFAPTVPRIDSDVFLVLCYDGEGSAEIRERDLDGHLEYVEMHTDQYLVAGPLREPGTKPLIGSFFLLAAESADAARAVVAGDPYVQSGLYVRIIVHAAVPAGGRFMGGVIWESADALRGKAS
ncbi:MAG: YciI family protein [Gammaproteobacteria bacterium]|nr:YciI family protein [Gammaproteobacteria bacterium]